MTRASFLLTALLLARPLGAEEARLEFEPRVGVNGARVVVKTVLLPGSQVRFGGKTVSAYREGQTFTFIIPAGTKTSFIEVFQSGKMVARSAVPFIVSGTSLVGTQKLIGLKEAIDVFGYSDPIPQGGEKPETTVRPILKLDDEDILTIGESAPARFGPAVDLGDAASAATRGMGPAGLLITARPPKRRLTLPPPPPVPTAVPTD